MASYGGIENSEANLVEKLIPKKVRFRDKDDNTHSVKFQNKLDCEKALSEGPWTIFGQYLTVQPWTLDFDPSQPFPNVVMA
ncbi:hypothetical protein PVK06_044614 [Gossypium arboreum]|uniref:DUF4283 domain-containing protein n=1 Tax=Gossypium arboreum TaxID=29729 RepID=A0ABR0MRN9_GOSAR|nr:hypothetical protein PVK06_044614 [Gossypium arboreum]